MKCRECSHIMELEETYTHYNDNEMKVEEHWWCPHCDATPTRFVTYTQTDERWEE